MAHINNLTRVSYKDGSATVVSGPVPAHVAEGAVATAESEPVPSAVMRPSKPKPPHFEAPKPAPKKAPTPTKEGK